MSVDGNIFERFDAARRQKAHDRREKAIADGRHAIQAYWAAYKTIKAGGVFEVENSAIHKIVTRRLRRAMVAEELIARVLVKVSPPPQH